MPGSIPLLDAPELGSIIKGRYRLDKHLGYGGIGQVFSATDLEVARSGLKNSHVTLKMIAVDLKHEPQARAAIQSVIANTKTLRHANIVSVYGVEHDNDRLFVIMEPLSGTWLGDQIRQVRKVGIVQSVAWPIIEGIANGLAHAHNNNIVHSDLSPYSIFVTEDGTPKIMGFGMIHALPTSNEAMDLLDTMTLRAYSEAYTADTWATHATPHPSDDLYPLGTIAYEMLTGTHPFNRNSLTSARQKNLKYEPVVGLNRRASKLIAHCLSFERAERPKNAARFVKRMQGSELLRTLFGDRFSVAGPNSEK
jgi:serine/threonine protein kinase